MANMVKATVLAAALVAAVGLGARPAASAERASFHDTARYLAGLPPAADTPLARLTQNPAWQQHARSFDAAWADLDRRQLSKIRDWTERNVKEPMPTLFYMFSGPDFLYANAFFPKASTYVMSGLEAVGRVPEISELSHHALPNLRAALNSSLNYSFFISREIRGRIDAGALSGTLPILYVFIARSGHTIRDVQLVNLDAEGVAQPAASPVGRGASPGVRIVFAKPGGEPQTLYYFRTDVSDGGLKQSGFMQFCDKLGQGDALLKSTSYLMHSGNFAKVRDFVLSHAQTIVQDDSGVPVSALKPEQWQVSLFGKYLGPISEFPDRYQPRLQDMYARGAQPLDFGIGYRWRTHESNVILAVRKKRLEAGAQ